MKLNEFQNKVMETVLGETSRTYDLELDPDPATLRELVDKLSTTLITAAIACDKTGITLEYVCKVALEYANGNKGASTDVERN